MKSYLKDSVKFYSDLPFSFFVKFCTIIKVIFYYFSKISRSFSSGTFITSNFNAVFSSKESESLNTDSYSV